MKYYWITYLLADELKLIGFRRGNEQGYIVMHSDLMIIDIEAKIAAEECVEMTEQEALEYINNHNI